MASSRIRTTKDGRRYYEIKVSNGRGKTPYTERWYIPEGLSQKSIERELHKAEAVFETRCRNGEVTTRAEAREIEEQRKQEESKYNGPLVKTTYEKNIVNKVHCLIPEEAA